MSADIVNLRQARKRKERGKKEARAAENRQVYGMSKANRRLEEAKKNLENEKLSSKLRIRPAPDAEGGKED